MCIPHLHFPHACLWRFTGEAVISSTQLTDMDEKKIGKSGPGVEHTCRPKKMDAMKLPEPNEGFIARETGLFPTPYQLV